MRATTRTQTASREVNRSPRETSRKQRGVNKTSRAKASAKRKSVSPSAMAAYQSRRETQGDSRARARARTKERTRKSVAESSKAVHRDEDGSISSLSIDGQEVPVELDSNEQSDPHYTSRSIRSIRREERTKRMRASSRRYILRAIIAVGVVVALLAGWAALYNSPVFTIENVEVNGVEHLTGEEMKLLADVPTDTTLLRVDTDKIANRLKVNSWVQDVTINRVFPSTLQINVTERPVSAIVEIPTNAGGSVKKWAIADDHMWLMPIPEAGSEEAKSTSQKIYEDEANALHIVDVPYDTKAKIGEVCTDSNVNNALDIIAGMTTDLRGKVVKVSAAGPAETTLLLDDGVEIAFGKAEDIRDKERVILKILEENPGVTYINVRMVETPTWRAI